jgi:hypothetical protein
VRVSGAVQLPWTDTARISSPTQFLHHYTDKYFILDLLLTVSFDHFREGFWACKSYNLQPGAAQRYVILSPVTDFAHDRSTAAVN